jgi:hypothetical protein
VHIPLVEIEEEHFMKENLEAENSIIIIGNSCVHTTGEVTKNG